MKLESAYKFKILNRGRHGLKERGSTLTPSHRCHRTRVPFGHVLIERSCFTKHCKRVQQRKKKINPPQTTIPFQKHKTKITKRVRSVIRCNTRELSYVQKVQQREAWPQRVRGNALTVPHTCHRTRIPFGHVLIERRSAFKHCKRGCNIENKDHPPQTTKKSTVSTTQQQQ